jgi:hypothetical protein
MADALPWIVLSIMVIIAVVAVVFIKFFGKKQPHTPDYRSFFWIGLVWTVLSVATMAYGAFRGYDYSYVSFLPMGVIFLALGLAHRRDWGKPAECCMTRSSKLAIGIAVLAGLVAVAVLLLMTEAWLAG